MQCAKKLESVPEYLSQYLCQLEDDGYDLNFTCAASVLQNILEQLFLDKSVEIKDLQVTPSDLETIFRSLMQ